MSKINVIYDGDMGGDDLWAIAMMLAHPERFNVLGITTVFGNVSLERATKNVCELLNYTGFGHIPVYKGSDRALDGTKRLGDDAYGEEGIGNTKLPDGSKAAESNLDAVSFIKQQLHRTRGPIFFPSTGPLTNIATVCHDLVDDPSLLRKMKIEGMGGALNPPSYGDNAIREGTKGNITPYAEFNFFQDSLAADLVLNSGVDITLLTMDSNQHFFLTPQHMDIIRSIGKEHDFGQNMMGMLEPAADLDIPKFGTTGPFVHDPCVIAHMLEPGLFSGHRYKLRVTHDEDLALERTRNGELNKIGKGSKGDPLFLDNLEDPNLLFNIFKTSLEKLWTKMEPRYSPDSKRGARVKPRPQ